MKVKIGKQKGFTLIELLAVIAIMAVIGNIIISLFISSQKTFMMANNENIIQDEGRMIVEFLENDIKIGKKKSSQDISNIVLGAVKIDGIQYNCDFAMADKITPVFSFTMKETDGAGNKVEVLYSYVKAGNKLIKAKKSGTNTLTKMGTLTEHLKSISVSPTAPYKIEFTLEAPGSENTFNLTVTPRNI